MLSFKLPKKLARFTPDFYAPVAAQTASFRVAIQNNEAAQLVLNSDDINSLWSIFSNEFCNLSARGRAKYWVPYFEIHHDRIIQELVVYPLWIFPCFSFSLMTEINYILKNKEYLELRRQIKIGVIEIPEEQSFETKENSISSYLGLMSFILGSDEYRKINLELLKNPYNFLGITEKGAEVEEDLKSVIRKIDSIEIRNSLLIISANGYSSSS